MPAFQSASPDERNMFLHLVLDCIDEAAAIIAGRTYGYGIVGPDLERVGQATAELMEALHDARWVLADPARWQTLQMELRAQDAESDPAFREFIRQFRPGRLASSPRNTPIHEHK